MSASERDDQPVDGQIVPDVGQLDPVLDSTKLAAARLWATNKHPYLASAIFACSANPAPGIGRLVVDRWWRVHADPDIVEHATVAELGGELLHLTMHLLRDHAGRANDVGLKEQAELHHWVDAADAEISDDLPPDLDRLSPRVVALDLGANDGRLAEEYYRSGGVREGETNDCGSGAHGWSPTWEPPPPSDHQDQGLKEDAQTLVRTKVASDIAQAEADGVQASLRSWAEDQLGASIDWRRTLAAALRRSIASVSGAVDYSYSRPSRRAASVGSVVMPALRRPTVEVAVVIDTSASVSHDQLGLVVAEIDGLLQATGTRSIHFLACDDAVQTVGRITKRTDIQLIGGGGTDMGAGIGAALETRPSPAVIVVLTDGFTPWPEANPARAHVVVALLNSDIGIEPPQPPGWTTVVRVEAL